MQVSLLNHIDNTLENCRVVNDYCRRILLVNELDEKIGAYNDAVSDSAGIKVNSDYFPKWLSRILDSIWLIAGGRLVCENRIEIGTFLALLNLFEIIWALWAHQHNSREYEVAEAFAAL